MTPPDLAALMAAPTPAFPEVTPPESAGAGSRAAAAPTPKAGPPTGRDARFAGHARRTAQPRRHAFRRS
ncbi:hypothetical protein [Micromonospora sp. NPDC050200]|uniref:hypothetical protein n=1 Tax=Micromonospora sp. NPDC050200 TaxID=3155664 RepID=UPI0033E508D5